MASVPLVPTLDQVIAWIESCDNHNALRFEPSTFLHDRYATFSILQTIGACNVCSHDTAKMIAATSWGKFQLMGFNLYSGPLHYRGTIGDYFGDEKRQIQTFYDFLALKQLDYQVSDLAHDQTKREHFALVYNGALSYAENIVESLQHFGVPTT